MQRPYFHIRSPSQLTRCQDLNMTPEGTPLHPQKGGTNIHIQPFIFISILDSPSAHALDEGPSKTKLGPLDADKREQGERHGNNGRANSSWLFLWMRGLPPCWELPGEHGPSEAGGGWRPFSTNACSSH